MSTDSSGGRALLAHRESWEARCHFCGGPAYPWTTSDATWAKVEPSLGQSQACFECFGAAWHLLGHNNGQPFSVRALTGKLCPCTALEPCQYPTRCPRKVGV